MSLTQEQYDSIMHDYQVKRSRHENELRARRAEVYAKIPEYRTLDREIPALAVTVRAAGTPAIGKASSAAASSDRNPPFSPGNPIWESAF